jgi:hypothetical protein
MNDDISVPDIVVPDGDVSLPLAVQRLAQAWQTSIPSAQAKMRAVLLSGRSIVAYARGLTTGREFEIRSECWVTEWGPQWLEDGVCELPDEGGKVRITHEYERFDMFYEPEFAMIVIRETDLQRLIDAKPAPASSEALASVEAPAPAAPAAAEPLGQAGTDCACYDGPS